MESPTNKKDKSLAVMAHYKDKLSILSRRRLELIGNFNKKIDQSKIDKIRKSLITKDGN